MTRFDFDPDLDRLGDALRASTTVDLAREEQAARTSGAGPGHHADRPEPGRARGAGLLRRPRVLAGGTLGLAGVGTALVLALSAGGAAAPPAFAITSNSDGSLTVNLDTDGGLVGANRKLAAMGLNEHIWFQMEQGPAATSGAVNCVASPAGTSVSGPPVQITVGPGVTNTETIGAGNTGAGTWHVASCWRASGTDTAGMRIAKPGDTVKVAGGVKPLQKALPNARHGHVRKYTGDGPVSLNLGSDGGLVGANRKLAAMGTDEHIWFQMEQGPAAAGGAVECVASPQGTSVSGPPVQITVGPGVTNTETIAAGNTGVGTWHVAACWRSNGTETNSLPVSGNS